MILKVNKYDPSWPKEFQDESIKLQNQIGDVIKLVHHIGSTSVPGLMAKPIIDILLDVKSLADLDNQNSKFEELGYEVMGEYGIPGRRYFRKGVDNRTHHVHAFKSGDPGLIRHLAFRDYLIEHKEIAEEYGKLKSEIAKRCNNDMGQYCDEKDPFIKQHEILALEWYSGRGYSLSIQ